MTNALAYTQSTSCYAGQHNTYRHNTCRYEPLSLPFIHYCL